MPPLALSVKWSLTALTPWLGNAAQFLDHIDYMGKSHKPRNVDRVLFDTFARHLTDKMSSSGVASGDVDSWKGALDVMITAIYKI